MSRPKPWNQRSPWLALLILLCLGAPATLSGAGTGAASRAGAPPDSLVQAEIQSLLDVLGMGYSRPEMERTMLERVRLGLRSQDSTLARKAEPHLEQVVRLAFDQHLQEVRDLQAAVSAPLAAAFTRKEIQDLGRTFHSEPVRRLLTQLQLNNPATQQRGAAMFSAVGRDVQNFLRAKLAVAEGAAKPQHRVPPLLAAPPAPRPPQPAPTAP